MSGITAGNSPTGENTVVTPVILKDVNVVTETVIVQVPKFVDTDVIRPNLIDKDYERPVLKNKNYERPVLIDKEYERPVIKEVKQVINIPVPQEVPYEVKVPVPNEVPYDVPIVDTERINSIANETLSTLNEAKQTLEELNMALKLIQETIKIANSSIPDLIKMPKVVEERYEVKIPVLVKETVHVIGKIMARDK